MAPVRTKKRVSRASPAPRSPAAAENHFIPTKTGTPTRKSPLKQRRGITLEQKQAIIENLQLEITDRARRLRAQYHARAQSLRTRVEMRVNRVPRSLLRVTMEDLVAKCVEDQKRRLLATSRPPPVPEKDLPRRTSPVKASHALQGSPRSRKRLSDAITSGDKENQANEMDYPKKKHRTGPMIPSSLAGTGQVLSPTSTNVRQAIRDRPPPSPSKTQISRPASPLKAPTTARAALASVVEKAKTTRPIGMRKATTSSTTSSVATTSTTAKRTRRAAAPSSSKPPTSRPATRTGRRASVSSDGSTSTVVKKAGTASKVASAATRAATGTVRKAGTGSTATKTTAAAAAKKSTAASASGSTRVLRKRG
ncbi:hypothetical protein SODALDRAFT_212583 [Sodiomyces alkalinus F11]|uniref:Borealin N-terminal domain-containing protein n=1 Tax=Sodiomyces alkalinus (strain CBS 110278 / VKM F-3762 / F11) TaxID=1314773 RepID=A0A3N2PR90_SODAK|nr:hypothetical protein SODALDRAFT_212583 [Sodiomyces alkalinus F11]ROT36998.1 hypothetical protein SODALDRAFT_212583 [Sodiomyces alkalinus F11]